LSYKGFVFNNFKNVNKIIYI